MASVLGLPASWDRSASTFSSFLSSNELVNPHCQLGRILNLIGNMTWLYLRAFLKRFN